MKAEAFTRLGNNPKFQFLIGAMKADFYHRDFAKSLVSIPYRRNESTTLSYDNKTYYLVSIPYRRNESGALYLALASAICFNSL